MFNAISKLVILDGGERLPNLENMKYWFANWTNRRLLSALKIADADNAIEELRWICNAMEEGGCEISGKVFLKSDDGDSNKNLDICVCGNNVMIQPMLAMF